jgi:hypothetical protein
MKGSPKSKGPSKVVRAALAILGRVRLLRATRAPQYPALTGANEEAIRKQFERACTGEHAYLAKTSLPAGPQVFHLSRKGAQFIGAPVTWADAIAPGTAALWLSISSFAWRQDISVLSTSERSALLQRLSPAEDVSKIPGTFVLRTFQIPTPTNGTTTETHLHYWLAEIRPADQLVRRVEVILQHLQICKPFSALMELGLFGVTVIVPTNEAKETIQQHKCSIHLEVLVLEELQDLIAFQK